MANKHAILAASASKRWMACPPSARLCAELPDKSSSYALQGTDAHELAAYKVLHAIGEDVKDPTENLTFFDQEMDSYTDAYKDFVMEKYMDAKKHCKDPVLLVEQKLDFSEWVPEGYGTGDAVIVADDILHVIDLKFGMGVIVNAEENPQLMCYGLGALSLFDGIYDIQSIRLSIFQPRRDNISTYEISKEDLLRWAKDTLSPAAELAFNGGGEFHAGDHCQFCKLKATCRKRAEYNLEMARYDFEMPSQLSETEISLILPRIDELTAWANDVREYALKQAMAGTEFPGYKLVAGRSVTRYTDENAVAAAVISAGYDPYEKKLMGITAMKSMLGKDQFNTVLGSLTHKPQGKPTLVPTSDKRPAINTVEIDFMEEN